MKLKFIILTIILSNLVAISSFAQISPGKLSKGHANLDNASNCKKCHTKGSTISSQNCLDCHKEIKASIVSKKGFHATAEVGSKECITCHVEHKGRDFQIAKINKNTFDHAKMGFELKGVHAKKECNACHKPQFISDPTFKTRMFTFRGLKPTCLNCHSDFHQGKLPSNCLICHNFDSYKNPKIVGFDHNTKTHFPLNGKHSSVGCIVCHKTEIVNGRPAQRFTNLQFKSCTPCHKDVHETKFGTDCQQCHSEESFHTIKNIGTFNHALTNFALIGKHKNVNCNSCHKTEHKTDPIKHDKCSNCHKDYHKGDFAKKGLPNPDCKECHTNEGYKLTTFTVKRHSLTNFPLEGAHLATSCNICHKKQTDWSFSKMGTKCVDCHTSIHKGFMSEKFLDNDNCSKCHVTKSWKSVKFDHELTGFKLEGVHATRACGDCHFKKNTAGERIQKFESLTKECTECHKDNHAGQFAENGKTECLKCHNFDGFNKIRFDHNTARFKLDGAHQNVQCYKCHIKTTDEKGTYIKFKFKNVDCNLCHS